MSTYIQIPERLKEIPGKDRYNMIMVYTTLRNKIVSSDRKVAYTEEHLAEEMKIPVNTIKNYIPKLKQIPDLLTITPTWGGGEYTHNVYTFPYLKRDYTVVNPTLLTDTKIDNTKKAVLILMKLNCWKGTNFIPHYGHQSDLAKLLGVGKNQIGKHLKTLEQAGFISFIGDSLIINRDYFPLFIKDSDWNSTYSIIYDYCIEKGVLPPYKGSKSACSRTYLLIYERAISYCLKHKIDLRKLLEKHCPELPTEVSMEYFAKALFNIDPLDTRNRMVEKVKTFIMTL